MNNKEERKMILADLITRDNAHNGYYDKLGISKIINEAPNNISVLVSLRNKINNIDKLIDSYKLSGNDLNNQVAFEELKTAVNKIFIQHTLKYIKAIFIVILLLIIFLLFN